METHLRFISIVSRCSSRRSTSLLRTGALALLFAALASLLSGSAVARPDSPDALLHRALWQARQAGSYRVVLDVQQTVSSDRSGAATGRYYPLP